MRKFTVVHGDSLLCLNDGVQLTVTNSSPEIELKFHQVPENDARDHLSGLVVFLFSD